MQNPTLKTTFRVMVGDSNTHMTRNIASSASGTKS